MTGELVYVGITQDRAPVGILERVHADRPRRRAIAEGLVRSVGGVLIVSTCERFELYATDGKIRDSEWVDGLAREFGFSRDALAPYIRFRRGDDAARHLLRVAAGLESRLLGERNILGQVRTMYTEALAHRELGPLLSTLGRTAIHTGKRVRCDTALAATGASVVSLALAKLGASIRTPDAKSGAVVPTRALASCAPHLAWGVLMDVGTRTVETRARIIVLGTGVLAREATARLAHRPHTYVTVASRSCARAAAMANTFGVQAIATGCLPAALADADGLIACSHAADGFLVERRDIGDRRHKPLTMIDLGMPRNIDPDAASLPGVRLVQLGQLRAFGSASRTVVADAEAIVERQLARFIVWHRGHLAARRRARHESQVAA